MATRFDHLVVLTADLKESSAWLEERLGVPPKGAGKHAMMGTHNALWGLGDSYLELIAVDPDAPRPARNRWFGFDDPEVQARLAEGPYLGTWAVSTDDLPGLLAHAPEGMGPPEDFARDDLTWQVSIAEGPGLPLGGVWPLMIHWKTGMHPAERLGHQGLALDSLVISGSGADRAAAQFTGLERVQFAPGPGPTRLSATLNTPIGQVTL
ncbi:MAG: VOC family protein [Pseudomonadota bacterium]